MQVLDTPHLTDCCGQHYCESCLHHWLTTCRSHFCPFCRNDKFNHIQDKHVQRLINELSVNCPNKSHGCEWTGCVSDLKYHLNSDSTKPCSYLLVSCPLECGDLYKLKDMDKHVARECTHRKVPCEHCGVTSAFYMLEHHYNECEFLPVPCRNNCGEKVNRKYLKHHESKECTNCSTMCLFHDVGCEAVVKREDYEDHVQKCKERHIVKAHEKVVSDMQSLKNEISKIKEENQFLHSKIASLHTGLTICHTNADILRQESAQLKSVLLNEMSYLHAMANSCELVAVDCVKTHLRGHVIDLVPGGEAATFRIADYSAYKTSNKVWYSPSFYIALGYKFCLAVHLNGSGAGKGTHVAVYLHQVAGQFDSDLAWPVLLEEDLEISLMRQDSPKESKKSFLKGPVRSPSPFSKSYGAGDDGPHRSLEASPTLTLRRSRNSILDEHKNVLECQILSISQVVNQPDKDMLSSVSAITKLELFCLQSTFQAAVFLNSVVIQCKLIVNQGNNFRKSDN